MSHTCLPSLLLALSLILFTTNRAKVPAIIVFGDFSVDSGNNPKSHFQPYGRDSYGGHPTGRFCNGRIPPDLNSEAFGLKPAIPAYLDPAYNISDFATGVCFASAAGTGNDNATSKVPNVISLWKELEYYKEYQQKLSAYVGKKKANQILREALYLMSLGSNDFLENYYTFPSRKSQFSVRQYQDFLLGLGENFIRELHGLGVRKLFITSLPPMGSLTLVRAMNILDQNEYNNVALEFNRKLEELVAKLNKELPGMRMVCAPAHDIVYQIIRRHLFANATAIKKVFSHNANDDVIVRSSDTDDDICKSLVQPQGYVCEEHNVTTKDGYILSMQRIPVGRSGKTADKPPVLLQHGILVDAAPWLLNSPDESLGFILADNGFDVWLANTRGTKYSHGHTSLSTNDPAYWEWSWDELVQYDLSALVQYVHDQSGQKLHYVGHSLGTLIALAAFSKQELLNMFRTAALLSPIAYMDQIPSEQIQAAAQLYLAEDLYKLGYREFPPGWEVLSPILENICDKFGGICSNLMTAFTGPNCCLNSSKAGELLKHEPQPTATKNIIHLSQMIRTGTIAMYDYGNQTENLGHYGQSTPPAYNMGRIPKDLPLFLGYGGNDVLADVKDVKSLLNDLKDHDKGKLVAVYKKDYAHADFILGVNANQVVYDPILSFFNLH